jgi:PAS domain S-box-containing protein
MEELFDLGFVAILVPDTEGYLTIGAIRGAAVLRALRRAGIPFRRYRLDTRAKDNPLVIAYTQGQLQRIARATPMARGMTPPIDIDAIRRVWRETDMRWAIALPLIADDQCLGVVAACSPRPSELDHEELDILRTLAIQAGRALIGARIVEEQQHQLVEITRLHEQTARQARELAEAARQAEEHHTSLATIHRVAHVVAESLDMQRVLSDALEITMDIMRAAKGAIYLAEAGHIHTAIRRGFSSRFLKAAERFDLDRTAAGEAMRHGAPFIIESPSTDHRIHYTLARQELDAPTMYVPLKVRDMTLGVLLMTARPGCRYSERDLHLAEAIATEIALGLRNAQLYRAVVMAHQQTAAILTNIGEGVVAVNANGAITSFNPAAEGISAWSQDQAIGRPFEDIVGPCGNNQCPIRSILIGNGRDEGSIASAACEGWLTTHHGTLIAVARTCSILRAQDGQHMGAVMTIRDISREKELQRLRNDFVSMVSHNLRAPLTRIKTAAGMLANADIVQDMATRIRLLGIIRKEVDGLDHLTTDVLNVARLERGNLEVTCAPFLVSEIISDLVESFRLATRQHEFVVHGQTHLQAMGDRQKTLWVLENILDNAVKYSPAGGTIDITIQPWDEQGRQWVHIAVRDRGIGIPQEEQQRVFDAFYRIHTSDSQRVYGQGLGLYIARWLVEAQGGRIWLTSTPNRGTEVSFILPEAMGT